MKLVWIVVHRKERLFTETLSDAKEFRNEWRDQGEPAWIFPWVITTKRYLAMKEFDGY